MPKMIPDTIKSEAMKLFLEGNKTAKEIAEEVSTSDVEVKPITIYAWAKKNGINKENQKIRISKEAKAQIDEQFRRTGLTAEELVDHLMGISSDTPNPKPKSRSYYKNRGKFTRTVETKLVDGTINTHTYTRYREQFEYEGKRRSVTAQTKAKLKIAVAEKKQKLSLIEQKTNKIRDVSHNRTTANRKRWQKQWQAGYRTFIDYQKEHGDVPIPQKAKYNGYNLGKWVSQQRQDKTKGTLSAEKIELLEEAGMIWASYEAAWQENLDTFIDYQEGNPDVPIIRTTKYHELNLGAWVYKQKALKANGTLSAERIERLKEAGFVWDVDVYEKQWRAGYRAFIAYKEEHGDVPIPQRAKYHDLNLGQWVSKQRQAKTKGLKRLTVERIKLLEEAGIIWDAQEEAWQAGYWEFVAYQKENPNVPISTIAKYHDLNLGHWVSNQRTDYNKGTLSAERIELLEEAGFVWQIGKGNNFPKKARITKRKVVQYCLVCGKPSKRKVHPGECHFNHYNIKLSCDACGTPFHKNRRQVEANYRAGHKNYCSPSCYYKKSA